MSKTKVSVTIDAEVLHHVDTFAKERSRSEVIEVAVKHWLRERRRRNLEEELESYYASMDEAEREEDSEWAELSAENVRRTWR